MHKIGLGWIIGVFVVFAILDLTALNHIMIYGTKPDLFLAGVLFFSLYCGFKTGASAGLIAGIVRDIFSGGPFGINILFLVLVGTFFGYYANNFYRNSPSAQGILSFLTGMTYFFFYYILLRSTGMATDIFFIDINLWKSIGLVFSLYTAVAAPAVFFVLNKTLLSRR